MTATAPTSHNTAQTQFVEAAGVGVRLPPLRAPARSCRW